MFLFLSPYLDQSLLAADFSSCWRNSSVLMTSQTENLIKAGLLLRLIRSSLLRNWNVPYWEGCRLCLERSKLTDFVKVIVSWVSLFFGFLCGQPGEGLPPSPSWLLHILSFTLKYSKRFISSPGEISVLIAGMCVNCVQRSFRKLEFIL